MTDLIGQITLTNPLHPLYNALEYLIIQMGIVL